MSSIPDPIFKKNLKNISWKKIYEREYGVGYSQAAITLLSGIAKDHFPNSSTMQVVIPTQGTNTAFYIDADSWILLVEGINNKHTTSAKSLAAYEKRFFQDGKNYVKTAKQISSKNLTKHTDRDLLRDYLLYQNVLLRYSVFPWSAFILNNYVSEKAAAIIDGYIAKHKRQKNKQSIHDSLFRPEKRAAVLQLQYDVEKHNGKVSNALLDKLYQQYKWLSCLDLHNKPWTKAEFTQHIASFQKSPKKKELSFSKVLKDLRIAKKDSDYLTMAKRFVYIKDARDDFRRQGIYSILPFFYEVAKRMGIHPTDITYLQSSEIISFLSGKSSLDKNKINQRKKGFVLYLNAKRQCVCLQGKDIQPAITMLGLLLKEEKIVQLTGSVASQGKVRGSVIIVKGVKDLPKVTKGAILVAVTTHPDYVSAMRIASAIVTDEGGITSHAAIVSREFGIPCIVGTKHATTLLKNGDFIEVDAIVGKIKML